MDFTIITPNMNHAGFLRECMKSVARQEGVALEHLVMDGGSTDGSAEVAAGFPDAVWVSEKDGGMSEAINKGFDRARGDWVMWLNADDRLKPGALAEALRLLRMSRADVVYGGYDFVDATEISSEACGCRSGRLSCTPTTIATSAPRRRSTGARR